MPILVFLGLSVLELFPMYATDRRQKDRQTSDRRQTASLLNARIGGGHKKIAAVEVVLMLADFIADAVQVVYRRCMDGHSAARC